MDHKEMQNARLYLLAAFLVVALLIFLAILYDTQIIHYEDYSAKSIRSIVRPEKVEASRGIITDRNGRVLVSNRSTYNLTFDSSILPPDADANSAILRLLELCRAIKDFSEAMGVAAASVVTLMFCKFQGCLS